MTAIVTALPARGMHTRGARGRNSHTERREGRRKETHQENDNNNNNNNNNNNITEHSGGR